MDYSKFSNDTLQQMASGQDLDYSKLSDDELKEIAGPIPETPSTAEDLLTGAGETLGVSQQVAGAAQVVPDYIQSLMHNLGMSDASPSQINQALASMGVKGDVGPQSSAEMYKQGTKDELQRQNEAVARSPIAYRAGEGLGLGLSAAAMSALPGIQVSKGAPLIAKAAAGAVNAAPVGALYGAANSPGSLIAGTPQEQAQVGQDAKTGAMIAAGLGGLAGTAGGLLSKAGGTEAAQDIAERFKLGKEGKSLGSKESQVGTLAQPESLGTSLSLHDTRASNVMLDGLNKIDDDLGQAVGKALSSATDSGVVIKAVPNAAKAADDLIGRLPTASETEAEELANVAQKEGPVGLADMNAPQQPAGPLDLNEIKYPNKFKNLRSYVDKWKTQGLNPTEMWQFRQELGNIGRVLKNSPNASDRLLAADTFEITSQLGNTLKQNVPDYGAAAQRMDEFRRLMPETILSKDNPVDVTALRMSGTKNVDTKLLNSLKSMVRGLYTGNDTAQGAFTNLLQGMQELNDNELSRKAAGDIAQTIFDKIGMQPAQIEDFINQAAQRSKVIQNYAGEGGGAIGKLLGVPKQLAGFAAEKAGQLARNPAKTAAYAGGAGALGAGAVYGSQAAAEPVEAQSNNMTKNPVLNISQKLYTASDDTLQNFSDNVLQKIPGQGPLAKALNNAIKGKDPVAKNAVLFSIMQNPSLRNLVESNNLDLEPR